MIWAHMGLNERPASGILIGAKRRLAYGAARVLADYRARVKTILQEMTSASGHGSRGILRTAHF